MIRTYKKQLISASALTLLPMVLGILIHRRLPELMTARWGFDGSVPVLAFLFLLPLLLVGLMWVGVYITGKDPGNRHQNGKVLSTVLWILPVLSNLITAFMFAVSLGKARFVIKVFLIVQSLMFTLIGNFLPKTKRNSTIGIKVPWTLASDENWFATHRFAGKLWFTCGILMMFTTCLPEKIGLPLWLCLMLLFAFAPVLYSYLYYKKQCGTGTAPQVKGMNRYGKWGMVMAAVILIFVGVMLFTGNIDYIYQETGLEIRADYYSDMTLAYSAIDSVDYRETEDRGMRAMGWGSPRLLLGAFENEEFGTYTRYSYTGCASCVVVRSGEKVLVLSGKDDLETRAIYAELAARIG